MVFYNVYRCHLVDFGVSFLVYYQYCNVSIGEVQYIWKRLYNMDKKGGYMIFSGYTTFEMIAEIAFTASVPLILLFAFTEIMQQVNSERKEVDKYIRWERIQIVVAILFLVDFICLIGFYSYLPDLF